MVLGEGVLALLAEAGGERGCLLVLEDLHWADPDTLDLVGYLAGAVTGTRVLLVLTARDDVVLPGVARLAAAPGVTVLPLGRLDEAGVGALAAACRGGVPLPVPELHELVARSDGLPFLVEELLGAGAGSPQVPPTFAGLVARRLAGLPAAARPLVVAAAVAGGDPDWRLVSAVTDAAERTVLQALRGAVEVGLLIVEDGRLCWRHALTRDAVLATLLPPERAALAARAAHALDGRGEPEDRAAAAGLYVEAGDRRRGAEILVGLARSDVRRGALRTAAMLLERAAATGAPAGPVAIEQVRVLSLLGRAAEALEVGGAALGIVVGDEHAELCLRLARAAVVAGRWAVAEQFVERAGRPADPRSLTLTADAAYGAGDVARALTAGRAAVQVVEQAGVATPEHAALLCEALTVLARGTFGTDPAESESMLRRAAQVAAEHGLTPWRVEALFGLGSHEHTAGDPAAPSLALARELALEAGLLVHAVQADLLRADAVLLVDGPVAALPLLLDMAERAGRLRLTAMQAMAELFAAADSALAGDLPAMTTLLGRAGSRADAPAEVVTLGPMVRGLPHLMRHDLRGRRPCSTRPSRPSWSTARPSPSSTSGSGRCCAPRSPTGTGPSATPCADTGRSALRATAPRSPTPTRSPPVGPVTAPRPRPGSPRPTRRSPACRGGTGCCGSWRWKPPSSTAGATRSRNCGPTSPPTRLPAPRTWPGRAVTSCGPPARRPAGAAGRCRPSCEPAASPPARRRCSHSSAPG